jgi:predicted metal-dependent RNase
VVLPRIIIDIELAFLNADFAVFSNVHLNIYHRLKIIVYTPELRYERFGPFNRPISECKPF